MKKVCSLFFLVFCLGAIRAQQPPCHFDEQSRNFSARYPSITKIWENARNMAAGNSVRQPSGGNWVLTVPVVIHVVWHDPSENLSVQQIQSQIDVLNEDFRMLNSDTASVRPLFKPLAGDARIEFCLAQRDPNGDPTNGITRTFSAVTDWGCTDSMKYSQYGGADGWPGDQYLNIWVCRLNCANGYAYYPGTPDPYDGVVIHYYVFGRTGNVAPGYIGRTGTHEVGHYLGLYHTFDYNSCLGSDSSDCSSAGDYICDTPADNNPDYGCPASVNDCVDHPVDFPDMTENYMDYGDDPCRMMFTLQQIDRMRGALFTTRSSLLTSAACVAPGQVHHDALITELIRPLAEDCRTSFVPLVKTGNAGPDTINVLTFGMSLDGATPVNFTWNGHLYPGTFQQIALSNLNTVPGTHHLRIWCALPNGAPDANTSNDTIEEQLTVLGPNDGLVPPLSEGFENNQYPPAHWTVINPDEYQTWERTTEASGYSASIACSRYRNFYNGHTGTSDELRMPLLDLSGSTQVFLHFDVAYEAPSSIYYSDTLRISSSTDCGTTWHTEWEKGGDQLSTVPYTAFAEYIPTAGEWRTEQVDLSHLAGSPFMLLRLENISYWNNDLYLDNINLDFGNGMHEPLSQPVRLWPSPAVDQLFFSLNEEAKVRIRILDVTGRICTERACDCSSSQRIPTSTMAPGLYLLEWNTDSRHGVTKFVIGR